MPGELRKVCRENNSALVCTVGFDVSRISILDPKAQPGDVINRVQDENRSPRDISKHNPQWRRCRFIQHDQVPEVGLWIAGLWY